MIAGTAARARAETCSFSESTAAWGYGVFGDAQTLMTNGTVTVVTPSRFKTANYIDVGVWVDDALLSAGSDVPQKVLTYFEHANCIYGAGVNQNDGTGSHDVSLRIAGNKIRRFTRTAGKPPGASGYWLQQTHREFNAAIAALGTNAPKVNLLFSGAAYVDLKMRATGTWYWRPEGGASNGIGQGQALVGVTVANYENTATRPNNEDWWGVVAAHELGHATGSGHLLTYFATMCCDTDTIADYTDAQKASSPSRNFGVAQVTWNATSALDTATGDSYADPYQSTPDPYLGQTWSYPQIHGFLVPYAFPDATLRRYTGVPCSGSSCTGWQPIDDDREIAQTVASVGSIYKLRTSGEIDVYTGTPCAGTRCTGWLLLDNNPRSTAIAAMGTTLYQLHDTGAIWRKDLASGWQLIDNNGATTAIAAGVAGMFQLHADGTVWKFTGAPCTATACPGWTKIGLGGAAALAVGSVLYQLRTDGSIHAYLTGTTWLKLDANPATVAIAAAGASLYQLHDSGAIWRYTSTPCGTSCPHWQKLDNNAASVGIATDGAELYQVHATGAVWRYTGTPCTSSACPGWQKLDATGADAIVSGAGLLEQR